MRNWAGLALSGMMLAIVLGTAVSGSGAAAATPHVARADDIEAANLAGAAKIAADKGDFATAIRAAEHAVKLAPADAGYRSQLGRIYLASGRFASADTSFGDALSLDPTLGRVAVSRALAQLVLGHDDDARRSIAAAQGKAADADVGLALALIGQRDDALTLLESAVRSGSADARTRQNLALVYAFQGRWNDAAALAARDVPADRMADRLRRWALIVQHGPRAADQVLAILGITMAQDPGQPEALALVTPAPAPPTVAALTPAVERPAIVQPAPVEEIAAPVAQVAIAAPAKPTVKAAPLVKAVAAKISSGRFVVQLGAYGSARRVEAAWRRLAGSAAYLPSYMPAQSQVRNIMSRANLYRLALSGFDTRDDAARICRRIRAHGGACFVRATADDRPMTWALKAGRDQGRA